MLKPLVDNVMSQVVNMTLHQTGATSVRIHSPDTGVLVLAVTRYPNICQDTCFVVGTT